MKTALIAFLFIACVFNGNAQKSLRLSLDYSIPISKSSIDENYHRKYVYMISDSIDRKEVKANFGSGLRVNLFYEIEQNDHWAWSHLLQFHNGDKIRGSHTSEPITPGYDRWTYRNNVTRYQSISFLVGPAFRREMHNRFTFSAGGHLGLVLPFVSHERRLRINSDETVKKVLFTSKTFLTIGWNLSIKIDCKLTEEVSLFGGLEYNGSIIPKEFLINRKDGKKNIDQYLRTLRGTKLIHSSAIGLGMGLKKRM